jgi:hypothetical protein
VPFTNIWDTTFPPDSQLANLLGQDLRSFRLDVQQRMGSISGLDASKPSFGSDAQPNNWNGVLFFAIDTGRIYQFVNPSWNDVTANVLHTSSVVKLTNQITHTGDTTLDTIYSLTIPALTTTSMLRISVGLNVISGTTNGWSLSLGGTVITQVNNGANTATGASMIYRAFMANLGATNSQLWQGDIEFFKIPLPTSDITWFPLYRTGTTVDTSVATNLLVQWQNGSSGEEQIFSYVLVEIF